MTFKYVLDAWAVMAFFQREEPAASQMQNMLQATEQAQVQLNMSIVNAGEIYYRIGKVHGELTAEEALQDLYSLPITLQSADNELVLSAARWKMKYPISHADAFAAATAEKLGAMLVTGDPELTALKGILAIKSLERKRGEGE